MEVVAEDGKTYLVDREYCPKSGDYILSLTDSGKFAFDIYVKDRLLEITKVCLALPILIMPIGFALNRFGVCESILCVTVKSMREDLSTVPKLYKYRYNRILRQVFYEDFRDTSGQFESFTETELRIIAYCKRRAIDMDDDVYVRYIGGGDDYFIITYQEKWIHQYSLNCDYYGTPIEWLKEFKLLMNLDKSMPTWYRYINNIVGDYYWYKYKKDEYKRNSQYNNTPMNIHRTNIRTISCGRCSTCACNMNCDNSTYPCGMEYCYFERMDSKPDVLHTSGETYQSISKLCNDILGI